MNALSKKLLLLLAFALALPAFAQKAEDEAGDVSEVDKDRAGPLRSRVPPVSGYLFRMGGRFEAGIYMGFSVKDAFYAKYMPGITLTYHFGEQLALALHGEYSLSTVSGAAQICGNGVSSPLGCKEPAETTLDSAKAFGRLGLVAGLELQWSPIYGKIGLLSEKFLSFNMYLALGPSVLMYGPANAFTGAGNIGIGFRWVVNSWITVRTEVRDLIYYEDYRNGDTSTLSSLKQSVRNQIVGTVGLTFFVPTTFERD